MSKKILIAVLIIIGILITGFYIFSNRQQNQNPPPETGDFYFGTAQNLLLADQINYSSFLKEQKKYSNAVALSFEYGPEGIKAPTEEYLQEAGDYSSVTLSLGKKFWKELEVTRITLYKELKNIPGFENVDTIVAIDEPYLEGASVEQLKGIIAEVKSVFPNKKLAVNFNRRGFYPENKGINTPIPDEDLDRIGFDLYPCNFYYQGEKIMFNDEEKWKGIIEETIKLFRQKTSKPIMYVAQGFGKEDCPLTKDNVEWSYEAAKENNLAGIIYWFAEEQTVSGMTGFKNEKFKEAKDKIIELGKQHLK
jgi:uncharacterized protein YxeA